MGDIKTSSIFDDIDLTSNLTDFSKQMQNDINDAKNTILTPVNATTQKLNQGVTLIKSTDSQIQNVISGYKSTVIDQMSGVIGALSGGTLNVADLTKMVKVTSDGVTFSTDDLLKTVSKSIGFDFNSASSFSQNMANNINKEFNRMTSGYFGNVVTTDGNGFRISSNWRSDLGKGTLDALQRYTGIKGYVDTSVTNAFYNSLLYDAADYGMSDSYESVLSKYGNDSDKRDATVESIKYMIKNGDVTSLDKILTLTDQEGVASINAKYPTLVETLLQKFHFDHDTYSDGYGDLKTKLLNVITTLKGNDWYLRSTQFGTVYDLAVVNDISDDSMTLLMEEEELIPLLCSAGLYTDTSAVTVFYNDFPKTPILRS